LGPNDLYDVLSEHKGEKLGDRLFQAWQDEVKKNRRNPNRGMLRVILNVFGWELVLSGIVIGGLELGLR